MRKFSHFAYELNLMIIHLTHVAVVVFVVFDLHVLLLYEFVSVVLVRIIV